MERYTKISIIGLVLPSFVVFFSTLHRAFATLYGFFYTLSLAGLNITNYTTQQIAISFWDPLVVLDPAGSLTTTGKNLTSPLIANTANTRILLSTWTGFFFLLSLITFIVGVSINYYVSRSTNYKFVVKGFEANIDNPYSKIVMFFTIMLVFTFEMVVAFLLPIENQYFVTNTSETNASTSLIIPFGAFFILYALSLVFGSLTDHYLFVMKNVLRGIIGLSLVLIVLNLVIGNRYNLYAKMAFFVFLTVFELIFYYNAKGMRQLKEQRKNISQSLFNQFLEPVRNFFSLYIPGFKSSNSNDDGNSFFQSLPPIIVLLIKIVVILVLFYIFIILFAISISVSLFNNIAFLFLILFLFSLINITKYNFEGRMKILLNITVLISVMFIIDLLSILFAQVVPLVAIT